MPHLHRIMKNMYIISIKKQQIEPCHGNVPCIYHTPAPKGIHTLNIRAFKLRKTVWEETHSESGFLLPSLLSYLNG